MNTRKAIWAGILALAGLTSSAAHADTVIDCPNRDAPFSVSSPFLDILLSEKASAEFDKDFPGALKTMPPFFASKTPPSFAAILTLKELAGLRGATTKVDFNALDARLRALPVTETDKAARCARYDGEPPKLAIPKNRPRILLFEKINGFRDGPSVDGAHKAFVALAEGKGWGIVATEKGSAFTPAILKQFDAVIWNNISGDVLTLSQRKAFQDYMAKGGAFIGVHGTAGDPVYFWDWYVDTLLGARFAGHPNNPQFQTARLRLDDKTHPAVKNMPAEWDVKDEWYSFKNNPRATGSRIIATIDEASYKPDGWPGQNLRMGEDHPIAWSRCVGKGRMFYSAIGHMPERYADPLYVQMLEQGIGWAMDRKVKDCR